MAELDAFAHDLFALLLTGFEPAANNVTRLARRSAKTGGQ